MKLHLTTAALVLLTMGAVSTARAGVAVVANLTQDKVDFAMTWSEGEVRRLSLEPGNVIPIPMSDQVEIAFERAGQPVKRTVEPYSLHCFITRVTELRLVRVSLPLPEGADDLPAAPTGDKRLTETCTIPVKLMVDDDEPAVQDLWEKRLRERLAAASKIFEHYCRVRLEVVAVDTWQSDNRIGAFEKSLREFERQVRPEPARLAIGFTSQYSLVRGRTHMGGTRGVLHSHILIREWSQHVSKAERLEVLVHELGHFFGAAHSPDRTSVMRPTLGDQLSHARTFRIGFDAINTFAMCLVCEELRARPLRGAWQLSPFTKARLRSVYTGLDKVMPTDPAAKQLLESLGSVRTVHRDPPPDAKSLETATREVMQAIATAARENHDSPNQLDGDRLTELCVRRAAATAAKQPPNVAAKAFLLGLGIGLDNSTLRAGFLSRSFFSAAESDSERNERLKMLGVPTMQGRSDLAQHFFLSAALSARIGKAGAEAAGVIKELDDARTGSGFSFIDLAADLAGSTFAACVEGNRLALAELGSSFSVGDFLPDTKALDEGISLSEFASKYGSTSDERFRARQAEIRRQVEALPGYQ